MQDKGGGTKTKPSNFPQLRRSRCDTRKANVLFIVQSLNLVWLFAIPWCKVKVSQSFTVSQSLLKLMSFELVMPSSHLILCHPLFLLPSIFPSIRVFPNKSAFHIRRPKFWSFSISPSNEHSGLISFRLTGLLSLLSKGLLRVFSSTTIWKYQFFVNEALSFLYGPTLIFPTWLLVFPVVHSFDYMDLCWQSDISAFHIGNIMKRTNLHWQKTTKGLPQSLPK